MASDWVLISAAVAMLSLFIAVLLHMVAIAFGLQKLLMWVKAEYMQVAVSFLIVAFAVSMVPGQAGLLSAPGDVAAYVTQEVAVQSGHAELESIYAGGMTDPSNVGRAYLKTVIDCERGVYSLVYALNFWFETASKLSLDIRGVEASASGFALSGAVTLFHYINNNIVYLALFHYIQYSLLQFSQYVMLPVFLPIGLALRAFAPTRGAGGFVCAFALGLAFIFPMSYVLIVAMMPSVQGACTQLSGLPAKNGISMLTSERDPCVNNEASQVENYYKLKISEKGIGKTIDYLQQLVSLLFLQALFYPLASLIIAFSFIRQTGSLLGADLAEIGRGLIKII